MHDINDVQEIRRLLDERKVDYDEHSRNSSHVFDIDYCDACGDYLSEIEILGACICATKKYLTPEQAIAATLGDRDYERKMDALLCRLTNGKFSKSRQYDLDFMESCVNEEFEQLYAEELADGMAGEFLETMLEEAKRRKAVKR